MSHYTTNDVLVLVGIYMTVLNGTRARVGAEFAPSGSGAGSHLQRFFAGIWGNIDRRVVLRIALVAMVIQVVCSVPLGLKNARDFHQVLLTTASVTANVEHEPDAVVVRDLYFVQGAEWIRAQAQYLREHHLSQFG